MKFLYKGCEALGRATIKAGCHAFFGYPITPQTELVAYLSREMPKHNRLIIQAESEISAINMVYGAAAAGFRVMTSTASPGMSLKAEGISYMAGSQLPCVIVNVCRVGPGLGGIQPSQQDYSFVTKGLGHGGVRNIVLAPNSVQEMYDLTIEAFNLADKYRNPVIIFLDGTLGQVMEPLELGGEDYKEPYSLEIIRELKPWSVNGKLNRKRNIIRSLNLDNDDLKRHMGELRCKYDSMRDSEVRYEVICNKEEADIVLVSFGMISRVCEKAKDELEREGINVCIIRPITLWPFPYDIIRDMCVKTKYGFLCVEMNFGQMVEDVVMSCYGDSKVYFYGEVSGDIINHEDIIKYIKSIIKGEAYEYKI